ncbi:hypothetical protein COCCU_07600 [Corynebacterium occultum]|uniref:DUF1990 domain-containing protein n=1 Tax=Corynebacterium occultum TaxID=2675219 RepID=A0A6B8VTH3_9CORY|nr:DUF1990 family protein [Corynebacterium occultum]QGU07453.1 hypothetical protein COCCU_07600 [Corynebacterium occultum]
MSTLTYPTFLRGASLKLAAGIDPVELGLEGWQITDRSLVLGRGRNCFEQASQRLFDWRAHAHAGVKVQRSGQVVELKFGPTLSPCLILVEERGAEQSLLMYGTLPGHVENGEEAFLITLEPSGEVRARCVAFSKPAWFWARLGKPVARVVQLAVTDAYLRGMRS